MKNIPHELFLSTVPCKIGVYPGNFQEFSVTPTTNKDEKRVKEAQGRKEASFSETYKKKIQVPYIPATDIIITPKKSKEGEVPDVIKRPLLQLKGGQYTGMKSGIRSSMLQVKDKFYRFKGCGNNDEEFILRQVGDSESYEVRGCMFKHTATRAIYMTQLIADCLKKEKITVNNLPIGIYEYDCSKLCGLKEGEQDDVLKCCAVFQTYGDKRLNDHVILGLERLLSFMIEVPQEESLIKFFDPKGEKNRFADYEKKDIHSAYMLQVCGPEMFGGFLDMKNFGDLLVKIPSATSSDIPEYVPEEYHQVWKNCLMNLEKLLLKREEGGVGEENAKLMFPMIYHRFGFEIGRIMRIIHSNDILWGTYYDNLGFHCNAHPNNCVLVHESAYDRKDRDGLNLLAPLDFDMSFTKDSFVGGTEQKFKEYRTAEVNGMKCALAGSDINTGAREFEKYGKVTLDLYRMGLRDTLLLGFDDGYLNKNLEKQADLFKIFDDDILYSLFTLGLLCTAKLIA